MSFTNTIPDHDDSLRIDDETTVDDVMSYLQHRLETPAVVGDIVVYNFHGRAVDAAALLDAANDLPAGIYVIPFQVSGTWGAMADALPDEITDDATLLVYRKGESTYRAFENWRGDGSLDPDALRESFRGAVVGTSGGSV